ncbi:MAG TPA: DNA polymerase III subunit gamma/tau [Chiayiivirga sp.]|nr:DNA polymerase III subunit gamma/tau [Chiayiivirga sp.]
MSYLVLARKWRPRRFSELVGQSHVVRALTNALQSGRVHHAFLFTGTRGIGKTTIARIFAKSLNCQNGVGAEPCGQCEICKAVDEGRFVDLLEIDAASNTGVDDVRELIENAQYLPTRGRYKVYLIDEVHMLSKNAFNALLKTLEEPPEHVKFLLATTDPQKLPVTVLSRCLQFNLQRLSQAQIEQQMQHILSAEGICFEAAAIALLAHGADGSLRDGLSLLDQALAFGDGQLREADVRSMLGTVDRSRVAALLEALAKGDGASLMQVASDIAAFSPDFAAVLETVALALHRIQLQQLVPGANADMEAVDVAALAQAVDPQTVQVWYQMALLGGRDLQLAPSPQVGFEMSLLRMLAFAPTTDAAGKPSKATSSAARPERLPSAHATPPEPAARQVAEPRPTPTAVAAPASHVPNASAPPLATPASRGRAIVDNESWMDALRDMDLAGPPRELGTNLQFVQATGSAIDVFLPSSHEWLRSPALVKQLEQALGALSAQAVKLVFVDKAPEARTETFADRSQREAQAREAAARDSFMADPAVRALEAEGASIRLESIRALDNP